jgi:hypothetical protein
MIPRWLRSFCPLARAVWENVSVRFVLSASSTRLASSLVKADPWSLTSSSGDPKRPTQRSISASVIS